MVAAVDSGGKIVAADRTRIVKGEPNTAKLIGGAISVGIAKSAITGTVICRLRINDHEAKVAV